ncbi:MAG: glycosyltransferase family 4 protein [Bryobacterales bacterium]|nr:glycosyltransferase family 4 protein [Bryobacterales bacterium]
MRILILSQVFHPDVVAVAQYTTDLARDLAAAGYEVTVLASQRAYDRPAQIYPKTERWNGIEIIRVLGTGLGKSSLWRRAIDFASVTLRYVAGLLTMPRYDVVVTLTVPPLVSFLGAVFTAIRGGRMVLWVMDLNPDQAIAAGVLRPDGWTARVLAWMLHYSLARSAAVVVLDCFMRDRIVAKGVPESRVVVVPPWAQDSHIVWDEGGRAAFRRRHGLEDKFVVMYSGNHSPCHPLTSVLEAARLLSHREDIVFLFVGGGSGQDNVEEFAREHRLTNVRQLPYQPLETLPASLSAADLQVVSLGDPFRGIVHPSKIYNVLRLGVPFLYLGPMPSHVTELTPESAVNEWAFFARHGDVDKVVDSITMCAARGPYRSLREVEVAAAFSESVIIPTLLRTIDPGYPMPVESQPATEPVAGR